MKLTKAAKIKLLENFYGLDYVFFWKPVKEVEVCCPVLVTEYLSVKGALLSTLIEMYRLVEYNPKELSEKINSKKLMEASFKVAEWAKEKAKDLMLKKRGRSYVKEQITKILESDPSKKKEIEKVTESKIKEQAYSFAIDTLLVARMLAESKSYSKLNDWKGKILEDAYKILRDNLIECAISMMDDNGK
jgi:hypothetical protein